MTDTHTPAYPGEFRMGEVPESHRPLVMAAIRQAHRDTFDLVRDVLKEPGQNDRWTFLQYCVTGWAEAGNTGFLLCRYDSGVSKFDVLGLKDKPLREAKAVAIEQGDDSLDQKAVEMILASGKACKHCGTALAQKDGTWVDRTNAYACPSDDAEHQPEQAVFEITHKTIETGLEMIRCAVDMPDKDRGMGNRERYLTSIPYLHQGLRNLIIRADLMNDAGILDVWSYAAIVEIALFGEVRYC